MNYIPLYSKDPEYTGFPMYYDKAKGMDIWIDGKKYLDMSLSGIGCNLLGYADPYVNHFVKKRINQGSVSTLMSKDMDKLTNLLLAIHPCYQSVRYCKGGGEALDLALMLALEKTGKFIRNKIYQVGYNGWKIKNDNDCIHFNNINDIIKEKSRPDIIVFELIRHEYPDIKVINKLKEWQKQGTTLICDEVTSGFRFCFGGAHSLYGLIPDITVYAKDISNGYPLSVVIGKEEIMKSDLWISSTAWTDSIGFVAGYYTLKKLKHCNYNKLIKLGQSMKTIWQTLAKKYNIKINMGDVPQIINFNFDYDNKLKIKEYFIQEMLKEGILATDQFYPSFAHTDKHIGMYVKACNKVFKKIRDNFKNIGGLIPHKLKLLNK